MTNNPACPIMTKDCPRDDCRLGINACSVRPADETRPAASCYDYECRTCGQKWCVAFPQIQPEFDKNGTIVAPVQIEIDSMI